MHTMGDGEVRSAVREVLKKASIDSDFRKLTLADGRKAIETYYGKSLPTGIDYHFVDNQGQVKTIALPDPILAGEALSDEELESVAGGCEVASCLNTGHVSESAA